MSLGEKIRKLRLERKWTQDDLGAKTGLGRNISSYETGHLKPSHRTVKKFADAFSMTVEELMTDCEPSPLRTSGDLELVRLLEDLSTLPETEVQKAKWFLGVLIKQHRMQALIAS